ncbi:MAG TPA: hypothetical protein VFL29_01480 [Candidatus Dormibacteraeota bacterium]|nr:hypothetical protein [Candidatus Dormibacteraeota bacterium]
MGFLRRVRLALRRARGPILASAATYLLFVGLGIGLASAGWPVALEQRDAVVAGGQASPITIAYNHGDRLQAALLDFGSNLVLGAIPTSVTGLSVVGPFPIAAYRGWVGGVVSIDRNHVSRLASPSSAVYYLVTVVLQLIGYVLTMGAGVYVGLAAWRVRADRSLPSILGLRVPTLALKDAGYVYALAVPVFLAGSLWEFLA